MKVKTENELIRVKTKSLVMTEPFESLFSIDTETYKQTYSKVYVNIDLLGFDKAQPIIVWKGRNIVIDGHTRLRACLEKKIEEVWVLEKEFLNEDDAVQYAVHVQRDRRKLTDADIFQLVRVLDRKHPPGRPAKNASTDAVSKSPRTSDVDQYHLQMMKIADIEDDDHIANRLPKTPFPKDGAPETVFNLAIHDRIPYSDNHANIEGVTFYPPKGCTSKLEFLEGDLLKGLTLFKEWAYGRSDDITATLIGTSRAKVDKCRHVILSKKENAEEIREKALKGKLTINRACSILKDNGKHGNGKTYKFTFKNGTILHTKMNKDIKWIIIGTHGKPPKIHQPIPKDSKIYPVE